VKELLTVSLRPIFYLVSKQCLPKLRSSRFRSCNALFELVFLLLDSTIHIKLLKEALHKMGWKILQAE